MVKLFYSVSKIINFRYIPVVRSYFSTEFTKKNLGFNIDLWKGFYASVRPSEMGFNLNVDGNSLSR